MKMLLLFCFFLFMVTTQTGAVAKALTPFFYVTVRVGSQKIFLKTKESPLFE